MINKILTTISILIYTVYSQNCGNSHDVSTMISYSIHGPSVTSIGADTYINIVKGATAAFTQSGQRVGVTAFGGIAAGSGLPDEGIFKWELSGLVTGDGSTVASYIDGFTPAYDNNWGNTALGAITTANTELSGEDGRDRKSVV